MFVVLPVTILFQIIIITQLVMMKTMIKNEKKNLGTRMFFGKSLSIKDFLGY